MIRELRPGEAITFRVPKSFFENPLDSGELNVTIFHEMKRGRSCRLVIEAPKAVVISKP
jgi:hypothetical protein